MSHILVDIAKAKQANTRGVSRTAANMIESLATIANGF